MLQQLLWKPTPKRGRSHTSRSQWRRGKGKAGRRRARGNEKGGGGLNKKLARCKLQAAQVTGVSLTGRRGYAGPRLRLPSHTLTSVNQRQTPKLDADLCMRVNLLLDKKTVKNQDRATGPPGCRAIAGRRPLYLWDAGLSQAVGHGPAFSKTLLIPVGDHIYYTHFQCYMHRVVLLSYLRCQEVSKTLH